jgi:hypothetical protein
MSSNPGAISSMAGLFGGGTSTGQMQNTLAPMTGSNQYASYPNTPGTMLPSGGGAPTGLPGSAPPSNNTGAYYATGGDSPGTNSVHMTPTTDPSFTQQFYNMLSGQVGQGVSPFNLSAVLPSSGQVTAPGTLTAPMNETLQQIQQFLAGGQSNTPGANQLQQLAATGDPINQTPAWQAMVAAEQQNTAQGANQLREQFASGGDLNSSPFGTAMQQYYNQATENQNAQLTQASTAAQQQAVQNQLAASTGIQSEAQQFGTGAQTLDQNAIQNLLQQFQIDTPQNNPLTSIEAQLATNQPGVAQTPTAAQNISGILGGVGSLAGGIAQFFK